MRIPRRIHIAGHAIDVRSDDASDQLLIAAECDGQYVVPSMGAPYIMIRSAAIMGQESREVTFVHEAIEAIDSMLNLSLPHDSIQSMSLFLHQILTTAEY
jgi:hypothetical protein